MVLVLALLALSLAITMSLAACGAAGSQTTTTSAVTTTAPSTTSSSAESTTETTAAPSTETTAAPAAFDGVITIGAITCLTGPNALNGAEQKWAYDKAVADFNAKGGVQLADGKRYKVELKYADDESSQATAAAAAESLVKADGLKLILGTCTTPLNLSAASVTEKYGVYYHMTFSFTDITAGLHLKSSSDLFMSAASGGTVPSDILVLPNGQPAKLGLLSSDDPDGKAVAGAQKAAYGDKLAMTEFYVPGTADYSSVILKFKNGGIDTLFVFMGPSDAITFVGQMKQQDFSPKNMFGWVGFNTSDFQKALGPDADYILYNGFWSADLGTPYSKELGQAYSDENGGRVSVQIGEFYATAQTLLTAIERAKSIDPAAVKDQVFGGTFPGTTMGDVTYNEAGIAEVGEVVGQWIGGKQVIIVPDQGNKVQPFVPWSAR
jgi:branched-chain amino acid transport system substrate-binding protein